MVRCNVHAEVPWKSGPKGYLGAFLEVEYTWDRGLGFSLEAAPSWDASALFRRTKALFWRTKAQPGHIRNRTKEEDELLSRILDI